MKFDISRLLRLARAMHGRRVAVVGDWMLDRYTWGTASRLSPEAPVPVVDLRSIRANAWAAREMLPRISQRWERASLHLE